MSKGLEALKEFKCNNNAILVGRIMGKQHYLDCLQVMEKSLKALEIIKEKRVNVGTFIHLTKILKMDYEQCKALNNTFGANICGKEVLTEEEFNLLKEVLE